MRKTIALMATLLALVAIFMLIIFLPKPSTNVPPKNPPPQNSQGFKPASYGPVSTIEPGRTTLTEVISIAGEPVRKETRGGLAYLNYPTESVYFDHEVAIKSNVVFYVLERNVGDKYKETTVDYKRLYGEPDLVMFDSEREDTKWYMYLNKGVGLNSSNIGVFRRLKFSPVSREEFIRLLSAELKMTAKEEAPREDEVITPGPL